MSKPRIELSSWEIYHAAMAGIMRQVENIKLGRNHFHGAGKDVGWQMHVEGCLGEYALSKYLDVHWAGKGVLRDPDVGEVDVRTAARNSHSLILHKEDPDDRVFWLLTGINGKYNVQGWLLGSHGKREEYWKDPSGQGRHAFFVPQSRLNDPETYGNVRK